MSITSNTTQVSNCALHAVFDGLFFINSETKFSDTTMGLLVTSLADKQPLPTPTSNRLTHKSVLFLEQYLHFSTLQVM